jgi:hypothetical protein
LPSACFAAPFTSIFGLSVHSPTCRSTRPRCPSLYLLRDPCSFVASLEIYRTNGVSGSAGVSRLRQSFFGSADLVLCRG